MPQAPRHRPRRHAPPPVRASRNAKVPQPENRSAIFLARARCAPTSPAMALLGGFGRLQEAAGRQRDGNAVEHHDRLFRLDDDLAIDRQPREALRDGEMRGERGAPPRTACRCSLAATSRPDAVDGDGDAEGARRRGDQRGELPYRGRARRRSPAAGSGIPRSRRSPPKAPCCSRAACRHRSCAPRTPPVAASAAAQATSSPTGVSMPRLCRALHHDVALPGAVGAAARDAGWRSRRRCRNAGRRLDAQRRRLGHRNQHAAIAFDRRRSPPRRAARTARTPDRARCRRRRRPARQAARW